MQTFSQHKDVYSVDWVIWESIRVEYQVEETCHGCVSIVEVSIAYGKEGGSFINPDGLFEDYLSGVSSPSWPCGSKILLSSEPALR